MQRRNMITVKKFDDVFSTIIQLSITDNKTIASVLYVIAVGG